MTRLPSPPALPRPASRSPFPVLAVVAPVVGAVAIGVMTGSPFMLVFAVLSPVVAIATMLDSRRGARRHLRAEAERFARECAAYELAIDEAHDRERAEADGRHPPLTLDVVSRSAAGELRVGTAPGPSASAPTEPPPSEESPEGERLRRMLARAGRHPGLPVLIPAGPVAVEGAGIPAAVLARQLEAETGSPVARLAPGSPPATGVTLLRLRSATRLQVLRPGRSPLEVRPEYVTALRLERRRAVRAGGAPNELPTRVRWAELGTAPAGAPSEASESGGIPIGVAATGVASIDLDSQGPHVLVGGTTGSGKSEFLRALALGWAARHPPSAVRMLFVDFKGGATFAGLTELPHAAGLVTDLDPLVAQRALRSLRAELRRRERVLAAAGVRDARQRPELLPRLIVLVDEFATLLEAFPELHGAFADLSARGRSLGVHLILCTQHPVGVVRDSVAANCAIRVSFRVTTEAAGGSIVGAAARGLVAAPPGRAVIVDGNGVRTVQAAVVDDDDIEAVRARWPVAESVAPTWLPPLPAIVARGELAELDPGEVGPRGSGLAFGMLDDPDRQCRGVALWSLVREGSLAILGTAHSGRTTALATLAQAARLRGMGVLLLPAGPADAWACLEEVAANPPGVTLLLADDLDRLLGALGDLAPEALARWDAAVRALRDRGGGGAAVLGSASSARGILPGRFASRIVLRCADADEHVLAGAPREMFDRAAPPGRGWWLEHAVQVALPDEPLESASPPPVPAWSPAPDADVIVVTRRPDLVAAAFRAAAPAHRVVHDLSTVDPSTPSAGPAIVLQPRALIGDADSWQGAWSQFSALRRTTTIVIAHAEAAELRSLTAQRSTPPPLDLARGDIWVIAPGEGLRRMRWAPLALA